MSYSSFLAATELQELGLKKQHIYTKSALHTFKSNSCIVKNFNRESEEIQNKISINETNVVSSFFEELKENENLINKIKKQIEILKHEKGFFNNNAFNQRTIECLDLNLNYLFNVIQLFFINKFFSNKYNDNNNKNTNNKYEADLDNIDKERAVKEDNNKFNKFQDQKIFLLQKFRILKIYFYITIKFKSLRVKYSEFHFITIDEENRFINSLRKFFFLKDIVAKPSKMGLMYLRTLKFYLWKILKNLRDKLSQKMYMVKLGFYVTKLNFFCYISADFLIIKENNLFEKTYADKRWKDIFDNLEIEVVI